MMDVVEQLRNPDPSKTIGLRTTLPTTPFIPPTMRMPNHIKLLLKLLREHSNPAIWEQGLPAAPDFAAGAPRPIP